MEQNTQGVSKVAQLLCQVSRVHLAIPAQGQVLGIVDYFILFVFTLALADLLFLLFFTLLAGPCLFALNVFVCQLPLLLWGRAKASDCKSLMPPTWPQD